MLRAASSHCPVMTLTIPFFNLENSLHRTAKIIVVFTVMRLKKKTTSKERRCNFPTISIQWEALLKYHFINVCALLGDMNVNNCSLLIEMGESGF